MMKRLQFWFRYLTQSNHFRRWRSRWINPQTMMVLGISVVFLTTLAWTAPLSTREDPQRPASLQATATAQSEEAPNPDATITRTPLPPEYLSNRNQTVGITFAAAVLVLIVVVGVLMFMPKREG